MGLDAYTTTLATVVVAGSAYWVFDTMRRRQVPPPLPNVGDSIQPMNLLPARNVWRKKPEVP